MTDLSYYYKPQLCEVSAYCLSADRNWIKNREEQIHGIVMGEVKQALLKESDETISL